MVRKSRCCCSSATDARDDMRGEFLKVEKGESQASFQEGKEKSEGRTGSPNGNLTFLLRHEVLVSFDRP